MRACPALLILDIGLPKLGGWKVLQTIRATPALASMPVVMLTGATMAVDEGRRAALRPQAYFLKPMFLSEYQQLVEKLEKLLHAIPSKG
jgi:CheY-like chemotaxis protein